VVVWQEPGIDGVARIWARRIFGASLGNVLQVSPSEWQGHPIGVDAEAPALALDANGAARIAYRLPGGAGSPVGSARPLLNTLPSESRSGARLAGSVPLEGASGTTLGAPSVAIAPRDGDFAIAFAAAGQAEIAAGGESTLGAAAPLGPSDGEVLTAIGSSG